MKKITGILLAIIMVAYLLLVPTYAERTGLSDDEPAVEVSATSGDWTYTVSDDKAVITGYKGADTDVTVPSEIEGYEVSEINSGKSNVGVFPNKTVSSVTISEGIKTIGAFAFSGCETLKTVTIPASVTSIDTRSFYVNRALEEIKVDETNPEYKSVDGVLYSSDLTKILTYPANSDRTSYDILETVTDIDGYAFLYNQNLETVSIPAGVTKIGKSAFNFCEKLKYVYYDGTASDWENNISIDNGNSSLVKAEIYYMSEGMFSFDDRNATISVFVSEDTEELVVPNEINGMAVKRLGNVKGSGRAGKIVISEGIEEISEGAFSSANVSEISLPASLKTIGARAFVSDNVTSITVAEGSENFTVDNNCLINLSDYSMVAYPAGLGGECIISYMANSIGAYALCGNKLIEDIYIPPTVSEIERNAFSNCTALKNITIGSGVALPTETSYSIVSGCIALENVYFLGDASDGISTYTFMISNGTYPKIFVYENSAAASTLEKSMYELLEQSGSYTYAKSTNTLVKYDDYREIIEVPENLGGTAIKQINDGAFANLYSNVDIIIPDSITEFGAGVFSNTNPTIYCNSNSAAYTYAAEHGYKVKDINEAPTPAPTPNPTPSVTPDPTDKPSPVPSDPDVETPLAFPGAEGGGKYAKGARAYSASRREVYHVTNLNDSGEGSFRDAVSQHGRVVVFDVGGTINLKTRVEISGDVTILGQTAPGDGITITGANVGAGLYENIIRYLRIRPTFINGLECDAFGGQLQDGIIDHCSTSYSIDECLTFYSNKNVTVQNCISSESLRNAGHQKGNHGYGGIWGGTDSSYHHNLMATHDSRAPRLDRQLQGTDVRNNIIYNWGETNSAYGGESVATDGSYNERDTKVNWVNNYYKAGAATASRLRTRLFDASSPKEYPSYFYMKGNVLEGNAEITNDNTKGVRINSDKGMVFLDEPVEMTYNIPEETAEETYATLLSHVGASLPRRDETDARVINDVINGTGRIIDNASEVGGVMQYEPTYRVFEIPKEWKEANGMGDVAETDVIADGKWAGYMWIEEYVNDWTEQQSAPTNPTVTVSTDKTAVNGNEPIFVSVDATALGGTEIVKVDIYDNDRIIRSHTGAETADSIQLGSGTHYISAVAYNNRGESTRSTPNVITVSGENDGIYLNDAILKDDTVTFSITNNSGGIAPAQYFISVYDENGVLTDCDSSVIDIPKSTITIKRTINAPDSTTVKLFLWDKDMLPYIEPCLLKE